MQVLCKLWYKRSGEDCEKWLELAGKYQLLLQGLTPESRIITPLSSLQVSLSLSLSLSLFLSPVFHLVCCLMGCFHFILFFNEISSFSVSAAILVFVLVYVSACVLNFRNAPFGR